MTKNIAIFASGRGSNAAKIIDYFQDKPEIARVVLIISNKSNAGVLAHARQNKIDHIILKRQDFFHSNILLEQLRSYGVDFIVLAGFLWLVPKYLIQAFPEKIINIHPSLLPEFGGKGMYGMNVHKAVKAAGKRATGITIHFVNEVYDEGKILLQEQCDISEQDEPQDIARKVQQLEHEHYPKVIEKLCVEGTA